MNLKKIFAQREQETAAARDNAKSGIMDFRCKTRIMHTQITHNLCDVGGRVRLACNRLKYKVLMARTAACSGALRLRLCAKYRYVIDNSNCPRQNRARRKHAKKIIKQIIIVTSSSPLYSF